jgi:hypothetical protein
VTVFKGSVEICEICFGDWGLWLEEENRKQKTEFRSQNLGVANWNIDFEPVGVPSETLIKPKSCRHSEPAIHFGDSDSCFLFSVFRLRSNFHLQPKAQPLLPLVLRSILGYRWRPF